MTRIPSIASAKNMQSLGKIAKRNVARFSVLPPIVDQNKGRIEAEVVRKLERKPALSNVPLVLFGIEVDTHAIDCTYNLIAAVFDSVCPARSRIMRLNVNVERQLVRAGAEWTIYRQWSAGPCKPSAPTLS
jgi:hypothetical protein